MCSWSSLNCIFDSFSDIERNLHCCNCTRCRKVHSLKNRMYNCYNYYYNECMETDKDSIYLQRLHNHHYRFNNNLHSGCISYNFVDCIFNILFLVVSPGNHSHKLYKWLDFKCNCNILGLGRVNICYFVNLIS